MSPAPYAPAVHSPVVMRRRGFCYRAVASAAWLVLAPWQTMAANARRRGRGTIPLAELDPETFAGQLNTLFSVHAGEPGWRRLQLIRMEMKERFERENPGALDANFERFSLVFAGLRTEALEQETYLFEHPQIGRFELFIVPVISSDPVLQKYEAVFNRPKAFPRNSTTF